jgi:Ser/Thr protein kinase RdoA (MazF antagonist)
VEHIQGEVTWVNDMAEYGIPVSPAIPSIKGKLTEIIPDCPSGTYFTVTSFQWAPGVLLDDHPEEKAKYWNNDLFKGWGQVLGQIHNHAQFHAHSLEIQRPQWHEYDVLDLDRFIPADQTSVLNTAKNHLAKLQAFPKSASVYGLTHADLTQWNFNVHNGKITVYDFDSTEYGWFVKDLAVSLYYAGSSYEGDDLDAFNQGFLKHLVAGYRQVRPISAIWLKHIPDFLFLQRIILYAYCYQLGYLEDPTENNLAYLEKTRKIIESGEEPMKLDFTSL